MNSQKDGAVLIGTIGLCSLVLFASANLNQISVRLEPRAGTAQRDCTTKLAPDLYGLGVRLGVYFQWISAWVSNSFLSEEIVGGLDANAMYLSAILIAIVNSTAFNNEMTLMDGLILMWLCAGTTGSVLSLWGYRTCAYRKEGLPAIRRFGGFGTHLRLSLTTATAAYAIWYWSVAVRPDTSKGEKMLPFGRIGEDINENCTDPFVTIFGRNVQDPPTRYFALTLSIINGAYCALHLFAAPLAPITRLWKIRLLWKHQSWASSTRLRFATAASEKQLALASYVLSGATFGWMCFTAVSIELMLNENSQQAILGGTANHGNILTPGQLLPMIIGAFSFIRVLDIAFKKWRDPSDDSTASLGREKSRRYIKAKRDSRIGLNALKLFSLGDAVDAERYKPIEDRSAGEVLSQFQRLNFFSRVLITLVPHISLFWSWPWVDRGDSWNDHGQGPDESELISKADKTVTGDKQVSMQVEDRGMYDEPHEYYRQSPQSFA